MAKPHFLRQSHPSYRRFLRSETHFWVGGLLINWARIRTTVGLYIIRMILTNSSERHSQSRQRNASPGQFCNIQCPAINASWKVNYFSKQLGLNYLKYVYVFMHQGPRFCSWLWALPIRISAYCKYGRLSGVDYDCNQSDLVWQGRQAGVEHTICLRYCNAWQEEMFSSEWGACTTDMQLLIIQTASSAAAWRSLITRGKHLLELRCP